MINKFIDIFGSNSKTQKQIIIFIYVISSVPSITSASANVSFSQKLDILWKTNKPLFVGLIALIVLIVFAIIFCIVYFVVIRPRQMQSSN